MTNFIGKITHNYLKTYNFMKLNEIKGGIYFDTSHKKNYYILENNLFDFRTINLKSNINHLLKLISRQNQLKQTNLKDIDKATDILYLSINFN